MEVTFEDEQAVVDAISEVRSNKTDVDWMAVTYESPKSQKLKLLGKGTGGADNLLTFLAPEIAAYALIRVNDRVDESDTVKFAFVMWLGENVARMQRARISVHQNSVHRFIGQAHVDLNVTTKEELSSEIVAGKVMITSGTRSRVLDDSSAAARSPRAAAPVSSPAATTAPAPAPAQEKTDDAPAPAPAAKPQWTRKPAAEPKQTVEGGSASPKPAASPKAGKDSLAYANEEECRAAIKSVRADDSTGVEWAAVGIAKGSNTVTLMGTGSGLPGMMDLLKDDAVVWVLLRRTLRVDESDTVKFVFINWVGEDINRMLRGRLGTWSGAVKELVSPYHVDINAHDRTEVTEEIITSKIETAAGRKDHVLA